MCRHPGCCAVLHDVETRIVECRVECDGRVQGSRHLVNHTGPKEQVGHEDRNRESLQAHRSWPDRRFVSATQALHHSDDACPALDKLRSQEEQGYLVDSEYTQPL